MFTRRPILCLALAAGLVSPALAQNDPEPYSKGTVMVLEHNGLAKMFTHAKDKAFGDAFTHLPSRIRELPMQARGQMPPEAAGYINMALQALARPARIAVTYNGDNPSGGAFGYGVVASILASGQEDADAMHATISSLMAQNRGGPRPVNSKRFPGMKDIQTPVALLSYGPRKAADGWRYEVVFGTAENLDATTESLPKAASGVEPFFRMHFDFAGLTPALDLFTNFAAQDPAAMQGIEQAKKYLVSEGKPVSMSVVSGTTANSSILTSTIHNAKAMAKQWSLATTTLDRSVFNAIPADATTVYMTRTGDGALMDLDTMTEQAEEVGAFLDHFEAETGVNLQTDLIDTLGNIAIAYMSDSTGGSGLGSAVILYSVRDQAKLWSSITKLSTLGNNAIDENMPLGPGFIRFTSGKDGDNHILSLRFNGLPIPFELTAAVTPNWLVLGLTPQAALVAARQASGKGDGGILTNKTFASAFPEGKEVVSFRYVDTSYHFRSGYTFTSMVGSAVANLVRSPSDPAREPGMLVPFYNDLKAGIRPTIGYSYWQGDDMISETHSDRSTLVNATAGAGLLNAVIPLVAIPGAIMGIVEESRATGGFTQIASPETTFWATLTRPALPPFSPERILLSLLSHEQTAAAPVQLPSWPALP